MERTQSHMVIIFIGKDGVVAKPQHRDEKTLGLILGCAKLHCYIYSIKACHVRRKGGYLEGLQRAEVTWPPGGQL